MSRSGKTRLEFGPDEQTFRLAFGELVELEEATRMGAGLVLERLEFNEATRNEISSVLRIGLIGGGMEPMKALAMVRRYCHEIADWVENQKRAANVLRGALQSEEKPGKPQPPEMAEKTHSPTDDGDLPSSTKAQPPRG